VLEWGAVPRLPGPPRPPEELPRGPGGRRIYPRLTVQLLTVEEQELVSRARRAALAANQTLREFVVEALRRAVERAEGGGGRGGGASG
jgi:hypothetical protein